MTRIEAPRDGTYRCPVCGHRDAAELREDDRAVVACSYCETPLEVSSRGTGSVHFSAQVAGEAAPR